MSLLYNLMTSRMGHPVSWSVTFSGTVKCSLKVAGVVSIVLAWISTQMEPAQVQFYLHCLPCLLPSLPLSSLAPLHRCDILQWFLADLRMSAKHKSATKMVQLSAVSFHFEGPTHLSNYRTPRISLELHQTSTSYCLEFCIKVHEGTLKPGLGLLCNCRHILIWLILWTNRWCAADYQTHIYYRADGVQSQVLELDKYSHGHTIT